MTQIQISQLCIISGAAAEVICLGFLFYGRNVIECPVLRSYLAFLATSDFIGLTEFTFGSPHSYWILFVAIGVADYVLQAAVMWELGSIIAVASGVRSALALRSGAAFCSLIVAALAICLARLAEYKDVDTAFRLYLQVDLAFAIFRTLGYVALLIAALKNVLRLESVYSQLMVSLSGYYVVALLAQSIHEYQAQSGRWAGFVMIEEARTLVWCAILLIISWQIFSYGREAEGARRRRSGVISKTGRQEATLIVKILDGRNGFTHDRT